MRMDVRNWLVVGILLLVMHRIWALDDVQCLKDFKNSIQDPQGSLSSWTFESNDVCSFAGITCLHQNDSKVYTIILSSMGLTGSFPSGLDGCKSLTTLDLSDNSFEGPIPGDLDSMVPYLVTLKLQTNKIGGSIPQSLSNCTYLNKLLLNNNKLTGSIPFNIGYLNRLTEFNVSHNELSGEVPTSLTEPSVSGKNFTKDSFLGNSKLCGKVLNKSCSSSTNVGLIAGVAVGGVLGLAILAGIFIWFLPVKVRPLKGAFLKEENRWAKKIRAPQSIPVAMFQAQKLKFADLIVATNEFSADNVISSGHTGTVFKATLADGSLVAVKRLKYSQHSDKEFKSEMDALGKVRHKNLVPLLGYCVAGTERLLVYKHMINGNLKGLLHGESGEPQSKMDWPVRLKIAIGSARGLAWLHHSANPRIIHRNISSAGILLDEDFEPRIADFGLARLMNPVDTHVSTVINGNLGDVGYVAPEYMRTFVATPKGDVYSFGVVLLEIVSGQDPLKCEGQGNLAESSYNLSNTGQATEAIDESLKGKGYDDELMQFLKVALCAVQPNPKDRPSMYEVFQLLRAIGMKYSFSDQNDDLPLMSETNSGGADEYIVSMGQPYA